MGLWRQGQSGVYESDKAITKFKDVTQCVTWRSDGKLLLAGEAGGSCAVVEAETRKVLRRFRGHGDAVTCAAFASADKSRAATGCRDGKLRLWDVTTSELIQTIDAHTDSLKALAPGPGGPSAWVTAGYDGVVRFWDVRTASDPGGDSSVAKATHGHPVEALAMFPGGAMCVSGGGPDLRIWDLSAGGRLVQELPNAHSKAVTSVCLDSKASVLLTTSFDCLAKVHSAADMSHIWTYRLPGPATCAAWRADDLAFVVGLDNGQWQLRQRKPMLSKEEAAEKRMAEQEAKEAQDLEQMSNRKKRKMPQSGVNRDLDKPASDDEVVQQSERRRRDSNLDFFLRKFEYRKVVEWIVNKATAPARSFAAVDELLQRGALKAALTELPEELLLQVLNFLHNTYGMGDVLQQQLHFEVLHTLLDANRCLQPPSNKDLSLLLLKIEEKVSVQMRAHDALIQTSGMLKAVMSL